MHATLGLLALLAFEPVDSVVTTRGTNNGLTPGGDLWNYSRGKTIPATTLPMGFNYWIPVTRAENRDFLYEWDDTSIEGFAASHQPSPQLGDYGMLQFMPEIGVFKPAAKDRGTRFSHANEIARPHYYSVQLDNGIHWEMTPTEHGAVFRITYPAQDRPMLVIDTPTSIKADIQTEGAKFWGQSVDERGTYYFYGETSIPANEVARAGGNDSAVALIFTAKNVTVKLASSFISVEQAKANYRMELQAATFDTVFEAARHTWNESLGQIEIEGATPNQKLMFYSNLYRSQIYPSSRWEWVAGQPAYASPFLPHTPLASGYSYVNNGTWDTARSAWQLHMLLHPEQTGRMLQGYVNAFRDGGWTPRWSGPGYSDTMLGTHSDLLFADAARKGIHNFDREMAFASMLRNANTYSKEGSKGRKLNHRAPYLPYIPINELDVALSWQLEDNLADFGIALMAEDLGHTAEAAYFRNRALSYRSVFSPTVGFFRGKKNRRQLACSGPGLSPQ